MIWMYLNTEQNKLEFNLIKKDSDTTQISFFNFNHNGRLNRASIAFYSPERVIEHYLKYVINNALYHSSEFFYLKNEEWWIRDNAYDDSGGIRIGRLFKPAYKISRYLPGSIDELIYYNRIIGKFTKVTGTNDTKKLIEQIILLETFDK